MTTTPPISRKRKTLFKIKSVSTLTPDFIHTMYCLFSQYYEGTTLAQFKMDLAEKDDVALFWDREHLFGFSTFLCRKLPEIAHGLFIFSGDTVVAKEYWGTKTLQQSFANYVIYKKLFNPRTPVYWMLISKGFKTYMLMKNNFPRSFPGTINEKDPQLHKLSSADQRLYQTLQNISWRFYSWKFGGFYDSASDLISLSSVTPKESDFTEPKSGAVRGHMADPDERALKSRHVQFFLNKNPEYKNGVELACVANVRLTDLIKTLAKYALKPKS